MRNTKHQNVVANNVHIPFWVQCVIFLGILLLSATTFAYTYKDAHCLSSAVYMEARGESKEGQLAVASVILNRSLVHYKSVCAVVKQPKQFSWYKGDKSMPTREQAKVFDDMSHHLLTMQMMGLRKQHANGALFFASNETNNYWTKTMKRVKVVGKHSFYKPTVVKNIWGI